MEITDCLCNKIIETISNYLKGKRIIAYEDMKNAFSCIKDILLRKSANRFAITPSKFGFKARIINDKGKIPTREDMFHIPFEKRYLVQNHRYSIHGVPSIYLGRSIYDCYVEIGKPPLDNFWVSLFTFSQDIMNVFSPEHINLIDLTLSNGIHNNTFLLCYVNDEEKYIAVIDRIVDDILLWPLIMACSIPRKYPEAAFQQEYIIPQMLYELCSEYNEFVGIEYESTKINSVNKNIYKYFMLNYALPAHDVNKSGHCPKLASQLLLTKPITAYQSTDQEIKAELGLSISSCGFPIISDRHESLKKDETIIKLDKMTMYFDKLIHSFLEEKNTELLAPLYGWEENRK